MGHLNVVVPCFLDPPRIVGDIFRTSLNEQAVNKSWTSREQVVNKSWTQCEAVRHCAEFHPTAQFHAQMESGIRQLSFRTTQSKVFAIQKQATTMKIPIHKCQSCQMRLEITDYKILTKLRCKGPLDLLFRWARDVRSSSQESKGFNKVCLWKCSTPSPKKWGKTKFATLALSNRVYYKG